jgi:hypothetical protein
VKLKLKGKRIHNLALRMMTKKEKLISFDN